MVVNNEVVVQPPGNHLQNKRATQSGLNQGNQVNRIDYNHPLLLSPADVSEIQIISFQLIGIVNYSIWFRSMRVALQGWNKLGLIDGTCNKEKFPEMIWNHWERVNAIVLSWIMNSVAKGLLGGIMYASSAQVVWEDLAKRFNKVDGSRTFNLHKEISTLSQGTTFVSIYFSKLKDLWEEFEVLVPTPGCNCPKSREFVAYCQKLKLYQFLMAYTLIFSDEEQKSVAATSEILGANPTIQMGSYEAAMYSKTGGSRNLIKGLEGMHISSM
uniref:Retrotransposon Copia-like N-terminal domain-containing protein n=1 Tax=Nicotiana tabacum TaxID=4097 RepID=A0A1S3ZNT4_TOBAC